LKDNFGFRFASVTTNVHIHAINTSVIVGLRSDNAKSKQILIFSSKIPSLKFSRYNFNVMITNMLTLSMREICDYIESNFLLYQRQDSIKINDLITYQSFSNFFHYIFSQQQSKVYPANKKITRQVYWQEIPFG
jgi:hypothetical protein